MTIELQTHQTPPDPNPAQADELVIRNLAVCSGCGSRVILFSRTIKTFCYRCGLPVTEPDETDLYYNVIEPVSDKED